MAIVGGGAAGFLAAITCAESAPDLEVTVLEKTPHFLSKVRISGGGRCNVTHACFDPRAMALSYPRGEPALIGPFQRFAASDTVAWFESRGVKLKTEADGRMFPVTDSSQTIIDCLVREAGRTGVKMFANRSVERVVKTSSGRFDLALSTGQTLNCDFLLLATGGCRSESAGQMAVSLGHSLEPPVPSLFTFDLDAPWLRELAGVSVEAVEASIPGAGLREMGPVLVTHRGLSGPGILRLSAWGARALHDLKYHFTIEINWLPSMSVEQIETEIQARRDNQPSRFVINTPIRPLPARLWERLVFLAGLPRETRWAALSRSAQHQLIQTLIRTELRVTGKSLNKDEFVTCGGVRLNEVNFRTMESRICPRLFFAGELLDIDGITGGFNFQAAWTTGWIAGRAIAAR